MKVIRFSEPRNGWIEVTFSGDGADHAIIASAVPNDCVGDLVKATLLILSGSESERVRFSLEPDYTTCQLRREGRDIRVSIVEPRPQNIAFEAVFPAVPFAKRLVFECKRLQPLYNKPAGWGREYPIREVECLAAAARNAELSGASTPP